MTAFESTSLMYLHPACDKDNVAEQSLVKSRLVDKFDDNSKVAVDDLTFEINHEWLKAQTQPRYVGEDGIKWYLLSVLNDNELLVNRGCNTLAVVASY